MAKKSSINRPAAVSRIAFYALLVVTMVAATLHLGAFTAHAAQATLSWTAPTTYTDGSSLTGLEGYTVHTGTAAGSYSQHSVVGNVTSHTVTGLNDGTTYYFAVTASDKSGNSSGYSNQVAYTTPAAPPAATLYTVAASAGAGGSITPSGNVVVSKGTSQSFTITPGTGYAIAGVTVDGVSAGAVSSYTFSNIAANHTISATFAAKTSSYTITASAGTGGSISPAGASAVTSGGSRSYTITPATGYKIAAVTVDGTSVGAVSSYTFSNVTANHTIAASFTSSTATTTSSATWQNRAIASQAGTFTASFDLIPNANNINTVTGFSAGQAADYAQMAATVRFNPTGTIDARNGSVYAARVAVPYAAGKVYRVRMLVNVPTHRYDVYVTPPGGAETQLAAGYAFRTEQASVTALNYLTLFAGAGSHQLMNLSVTSAATVPSTYTLTASAGTGGSISPAGASTVTSGGSKSYTITPAAGYKIAGVTVDGTSVGAVSSYTFSNVTANHTIAASFATLPLVSSATWLNSSIASKTGTFTATFDMIPNANNINSVTGFSGLQANDYSDMAAIVRLNPTGTIDARNGSVYAARTVMSYSAGRVYRVRMVINVSTRRYDVYVTPAGGVETQLAAGYAFRSEQAAVSMLNNLSMFAATGSHQVQNLTLQ